MVHMNSSPSGFNRPYLFDWVDNQMIGQYCFFCGSPIMIEIKVAALATGGT